MADTVTLPPRLSPVAALFAGTVSDTPAGVTLGARVMDQVQIDCRPDRMAAVALPLPAPGRAVSVDGLRLLSLAPGRWMALSAGTQDLMGMLRERCAGAGAALVDQSHGRATLRVSGARVREVLAGGTGIDLHPRAFAEDRVVSTALYHVPVTIDRRLGTATFDLHLPRGYARSLAERLIATGRQYGVAVGA
ncbi:sarcosine oxidase subunit gamma family protein [Thalassobaculum sp. OXR-137]|uniref:sarcosine oxidase subunit gamma n=1 Tax=Thalassobaculum sp. OXR-137 TaxID=3100173 RepID=UPI002AC9B746|nr:sarcosine oxidase subunit gamma family protein [Thalassobaculum sp. OXR-137]WPZ32590.1 sarcosine oxidase subunit gamma family protein [Thalassobaculum sp. OXR-137]